MGKCSGCARRQITLKSLIESKLKGEVPEVESVVESEVEA
jgi:Fe-S cluster biogenesis protein NfuA